MSVPFFDMGRHLASLRDSLLQAFLRVLDEGEFILGPEVAELEAQVARLVGASGAVGVSSGTDALLVALMALGIGPGDEVVTTPFTFFATAGAAVRLGARVRFVDIEADTFNLDPMRAVSEVTSATRAVVPVHLFGHMADLQALIDCARHSNVAVVEDAAQAIGASCRLGSAGGVGTCGAFSFFPSKNLGGLGDGGLVTSSSETFLDQVRLMRNHGARPKYHHVTVGGNFRLDTLQAAFLLVMLPHLERWTQRRRELASRYTQLFEQTGLTKDRTVVLPIERPGFRHVFNQYVVRVADRDGLALWLRQHGVGYAIYYPQPLHLQPCFADLGYREGSFPIAEAACREVLALPVFPELPEAEQDEVVGRIVEYYRR